MRGIQVNNQLKLIYDAPPVAHIFTLAVGINRVVKPRALED